MSSRRRPLHTCGLSTIKIALKISCVAQDLSGPLGSMAKRVAKTTSFAIPFIYALLYLWLVLLSFADDHILAAEDIIERYFPPSKHFFNKIDDLVLVVENLPKKFDCAVKSFPSIINQVPFLDWALVHVISLLELLISMLTCWGSEGTKEKEITVDINCDNRDIGESESVFVAQAEHESKLDTEADQPTKSPLHVESEDAKEDFPPVSKTQRAETDAACVDVKPDGMKSTYKEVLEKGKNDMRTDQIVNQEERREKIEDEKVESPKDDPITKLFESGWLTRRGRRGK